MQTHQLDCLIFISANCPIFPSIGDQSSCQLGMLKSHGAELFQRAHPMGYKNVRRWSYSGTSRHLPTFFLAIKPNMANRFAEESVNLPWWVYISWHHDLPTFFLGNQAQCSQLICRGKSSFGMVGLYFTALMKLTPM